MWVDNIGMDLGEIGRGGVDWIALAQEKDLNGKFLSSCKTGSLRSFKE
jgi:hypothetical protein